MPVIVAFCFGPLPFLVVIRRTDLCTRRIPGCSRRSFLLFCPFALFSCPSSRVGVNAMIGLYSMTAEGSKLEIKGGRFLFSA